MKDFDPRWAGAIAVCVAILAALGLEGDALSRAVRNHPSGIALALGLVVVAVLITIYISDRAKDGGGFESPAPTRGDLGLMALALGMIVLLFVASTSVADREQPSVRIEYSSVQEPNPGATVTARGTSLKSSEVALLQVVGLRSFKQIDKNSVDACETFHVYRYSRGANSRSTSETTTPGPSVGLTSPPPTVTMSPGGTAADPDILWDELDPAIGDLLAWTLFGPDANGEASTSLIVNADGYTGLCAWIRLSDRGTGRQAMEQMRQSVAYLRVGAPDVSEGL